jgi:serine/threonine-protein kinase
VGRALDEARLAAKIQHVNVTQILDLGEEQGVLYLAMEYIDGDSLSSLGDACESAGGRMPLGILARVVADTCSGLHAAHELAHAGKPLDIVHRDVSPQNRPSKRSSVRSIAAPTCGPSGPSSIAS